MVNKRYMRKYDTCVGHEARINKLLLKKPPGIMSARSTSSVCEQCANQPIKGIEKKKVGRRRGTRDSENVKRVDEGVRRTLSPALGVESSETGCVPWVRLKSVVRCVT